MKVSMTNKNFRRYIFSIALIGSLCPSAVMADATDYAVKVDFDKKIINVDSLSLPKSFKSIGILMILPEILERPSSTLASDYDIQINDMSVGDARDAVLSQIRLEQIEKIEVSESPLSTYNKNGQGGAINIILRQKPKVEEDKDKKVWGTASVDYEYETEVNPFVQINYNDNKKFSLTGILTAEYSNTKVPSYEYSGSGSSTTTNKNDFRNQMTRVYMMFKPSAKNRFKFNLSGVFTHKKLNSDIDSWAGASYIKSSYFEESNTKTFRALFNYFHTFSPSSTLEVEAQYVFEPGKRNTDNYSTLVSQADDHSNTLSGKIEYTVGLLPADNRNKIAMILGLSNNNSWKKTDNSFTFSDLYHPQSQMITPGTYGYTTGNNSFHVMPYLNLEMTFGQFRIKTVAEYQFFRSNMSISKSLVYNTVMPDYTRDRNDFTGKVMFCWQFMPHQHLRLIFDRRIERPSADFIYPYYYYHVNGDMCIKGNADLTPMLSHEVSLDYISDYNWDGHKFVVNAGISYNNVSDIIVNYRRDDVPVEKDNKKYQIQCYTYGNMGSAHVYNGDLMLMYSYKCFALSFTGNVFHTDRDIEGTGKDHYTYYNLSLLPSLSLKNGWLASLDMLYYSKVSTAVYTLGDCLSAQLNIGKNFGRWNIHVMGRWVMSDKTKDIFDGRTLESWTLRNAVGAGAIYRF